MKLESDPPVYHSMSSPKCVPKPLECNYDTLESQNQVMSNNPIGLSCQEKINQEDALQSSYSTGEYQNQVMSNDPIGLSCQEKINQEDALQSSYATGDENSCKSTKISCSSVDGFDDNADGISVFVALSSKKPSDLYVDKSVMEFQMPKTIVCDKEIYVNDVKDICIDDGVSSLENFFFRSTDEKSIFKILSLEEDQSESPVKEQENSSDVSKSIADDQKISLEDHFARDRTTRDDAKDLTQIEEAKLDLREPKVSLQKLVTKSCYSETLYNIGVQIFDEKANLHDSASVSKSEALGSSAESPKDNNPTHPLSHNHELENGSITLNLNSFSPVVNGGEEHHGNTDLNYPAPLTQECRQSSGSAVETQVSTNLEFRTSDSRLISSQTQHGIGESSFSAVDPLASLVTYSGPIAYSGSISLRSESSAASTRSFAFPILQSEWNSSPVKMVKAERRHYRKYRGWREGLLCCRF